MYTHIHTDTRKRENDNRYTERELWKEKVMSSPITTDQDRKE